MNAPSVTYSPDSYRFLWNEEGIEIVIDRLSEEKDGLKCEMTVSTSRAPHAGLLREGRFNMSSTLPRSQWQKALDERLPDFDWYQALERVCALSLRRWRDGEPVIDLTKVEVSAELPYLIHPFVIDGGASVVFADGGSGKSLFALALAVSVATGAEILPGVQPTRLGPVLYLDWEWDEESHAERLAAICKGAGITAPADMIFYRHEQASIVEGAASIRRRIGELGVVFSVVDSLGMARGGDPESADVTIRTFAAIRSFVVPTLAVDHVAKNTKDKTASFGSVYTKNASRLMWRMDAVKNEGEDRITVGLINTKANRKTQAGRGYRIELESDADERLTAVRFAAVDPKNVPELRRKPPLWRQIKETLIAVGTLMTHEAIATTLVETGTVVTAETVRVTLHSYKEEFVRVEDKWGLLAL